MPTEAHGNGPRRPTETPTETQTRNKRMPNDVRAMSKHADFLIKFVEQKFTTPELGYEVIHRAARHRKAQTDAHKMREAKKTKDQHYLVAIS